MLFTPCSDWFFIEDSLIEDEKPIIYRLAGWQNNNGYIVGMISVIGGGDQYPSSTSSGSAKLVPVPQVPGIYKHKEELSFAESSAALRLRS